MAPLLQIYKKKKFVLLKNKEKENLETRWRKEIITYLKKRNCCAAFEEKKKQNISDVMKEKLFFVKLKKNCD